MTRTRSFRMSISCVLVCVCLPILGTLGWSQDATSDSNLPSEIRHLAASQLANPPRSVLALDTTKDVFKGIENAKMWIKVKLDRQGVPMESKLIYCSHPNIGLEEQVATMLQQVQFAPLPAEVQGPYKWLYHEVAFSRKSEEAGFSKVTASPTQEQPPVKEQIKEETGQMIGSDYHLAGFPEPDEFVPMEILPEMIELVQAEYPSEAKRAGATGTVWVKALVDDQGAVRAAIVSKTSGTKVLDDAALKAAYGNKYKAGVQNGKQIACWVTYRVDFTLETK